MESHANDAWNYCTFALHTQTFTRGDYRELCELIVVYLGGQVEGFQFKHPGACHHARFMAKAIYSTKMALLSNIHVMDDDSKSIIIELAEFCAVFYGLWFLKSAVPQCAPGNDCSIIKQMKLYKEVKPDVAIAVLNAMQGQSWYLTPPFVVLALLDDDVPEETSM